MPEIPILSSIEELLFGMPLYVERRLEKNSEDIARLYRRSSYKMDGHCPFCHKHSTFDLHGHGIPAGDPWNNINSRYSHDSIRVVCARSDDHVIYFVLRIKNLFVQKIGQFPSLAEIANDESKRYRSVLTKEDSSDFHKAIGLAAHGVGIGSFVYLRRVFEHLVFARYEEAKSTNGWEDEEFFRLRMAEKIEFLKDHLPAFLVKNKGIYGILSSGIHELTDEACLAFFDVMKSSIIIILEEDKKKKEDEAHRIQLEKAISTFKSNN